ncbi:MAG: PLP-dependent transferase [Planctomycetota bacterium]|nr:PLP-dependent transferase [Planctomycetota bacterium]
MTDMELYRPDLLRAPLWRAEDLGKPLPPSPHANSVCLPTWGDVIDYEKAEPRVLGRLQTGYPRFFIHPLTVQLFAECARRFAGPDEFCHVYPSHAAALRSVESVRRWSGHQGRIQSWATAGPYVCCFPRAAEEAARKHWRHTGEGISSRHAEALLLGTPESAASVAKRVVREQIAQWVGVPADSVYLFSSGMSAIYTVYRAVNRLFPGRRSVQFGFPYVDTLKLQQDLGPGAHFFPRGDEQDLHRFTELLRTEPVSAVYCEFPSNPLLVSPDLAALAELAERHGFPLVVDETLGTYVNVDLRPVADVLITSLTKYFTGAGDVLAGAAILNPRGRWSLGLSDALAREYEDTLWGDDAVRLAQYAADFPERVQRINRTAEQVCDFCRSHPAIAEVYYPKFRTPGHYTAFQRTGGGYGGLFSLLLEDPAHTTPRFFDALQLCKGPNLGTYFSLCCPFTLLAHYQELDWAESCGVSRYLVRVSVGLEEPRDLIQRLDEALQR